MKNGFTAGIIENCYSTGKITGSKSGGIVGGHATEYRISSIDDAIIRNCFTTGDISETSYTNWVGGIAIH